MKRLLLAVCAAAFLQGCVTTDGGITPLSNLRESILTEAAENAAYAAALARSEGDIVGAQCWEHVARKAAERGLNKEALPPRPEGPSAIIAWQRARNLRRRLEAGISDETKMACGGVVWDGVSTVRRAVQRIVPGF